jgi:hypothetical protein
MHLKLYKHNIYCGLRYSCWLNLLGLYLWRSLWVLRQAQSLVQVFTVVEKVLLCLVKRGQLCNLIK